MARLNLSGALTAGATQLLTHALNAVSGGQTKMGATVIITVKIMPDSPQADLQALASNATELISKYGGSPGKVVEEEVAFGLKSVSIMFALPEERGSTEELENQLSGLANVSSVQVTDVRRAIG